MVFDVLKNRLTAVQRAGGFSAAVIDDFAHYLAEAPDEDLFRMNPFRYAAQTGTPDSTAAELFLYAAHAGVLDFNWGVLCPICGAFVSTDHALRALNEERICAFCDIAIPPVMDENVEVAFTVSPSAKSIRFHSPELLDFGRDSVALFFSSTIADTAHIKQCLDNPVWFGALPPGTTRTVEQTLQPGKYLVLLPAHHAAQRFTVASDADAGSLDYQVLAGGQLIQDEDRVAPGPVRITLRNRLSRPVIFGAFIDPRSLDLHTETLAADCVLPGQRLSRFFSAKDLVTTQAFHELFRAESIPAQGGLALKSLTVLFTDLKGSTELYSRMGDMRAYDLVREHFGLLRDVVANHNGAVVKTIGDAVMASFANPTAALEAAAVMNREIGKVGHLELKIGLHSGPCIAVELNDRLDYFGQTVNIAARVQGVAESRQIVCTEAIFDAPGAAEVIATLKPVGSRELAALKGVTGEVAVWRFE
jgi:class 3 adenylate cyclase